MNSPKISATALAKIALFSALWVSAAAHAADPQNASYEQKTTYIEFCEEVKSHPIQVTWVASVIEGYDGTALSKPFGYSPLSITYNDPSREGGIPLATLEADEYWEPVAQKNESSAYLAGKSEDGKVTFRLYSTKKQPHKMLLDLKIVTPQKTIERKGSEVECGSTTRA